MAGTLVVAAVASGAPTYTTERIDVKSGSTPQTGRKEGRTPSIDSDGRYIAFSSKSTNLSTEDGDTTFDIFRRDRVAKKTVLVSRKNGKTGAVSTSSSFTPSISGDGNFIAFVGGKDLSSAAGPGPNVYVRDVAAGKTGLVNKPGDGCCEPGEAQDPVISRDGNFVAFTIGGGDLETGSRHIYVRDLGKGKTRLVDRAAGASGAIGNKNAFKPSISDDGRFIAFESLATNFVSGVGGTRSEVYVRDMKLNKTFLVSRESGASGASDNAGVGSFFASISGDGSRVAFESEDSLVPGAGAPTEDHSNVFVRDRDTNQTLLASRADGASGDPGKFGVKGSQAPAISGDGRFVAFETDELNFGGFSDTDSPGSDKLYVRDLDKNTISLASRDSGKDGKPLNVGAKQPALSQDGAYIAFQADFLPSDNKKGKDINNVLNLFVRNLR
jgi:Tol biopolymer transport system component